LNRFLARGGSAVTPPSLATADDKSTAPHPMMLREKGTLITMRQRPVAAVSIAAAAFKSSLIRKHLWKQRSGALPSRFATLSAMRKLNVTRRGFGSGLLGAALPWNAAAQMSAPAAGPGPDEPHVGNLYPFIQKQADSAPLALSFLRPEFRSLRRWQARARARVLNRLLYSPAPAAPDAKVIRKVDRGDYTVEYVTFQTTPELRVPAIVLIPKNAKLPAPGIVALHDHGGFYLWGKEKLFADDGEHPVLTAFRDRYYGGRSTTIELVRQGYVTIAIDMFYWGERRLMYAADPASLRDRSLELGQAEIDAFNRRSSQSEQLVTRTLTTAGLTFPGIALWDDLRTVDYLASRPEVDAKRLGCVGLSVGGYRSYMLAALSPRIKAAVAVGWMTSYPKQLRRHVINTVGFTFHIPGLYPDLDFPDLSALVAPRALMVINGSRDGLFHPEGVKDAFAKIQACYQKAGAADGQSCRMYDAPHEFNLEMQPAAWEWLKRWI
jgi:dienelactone hydrolase